MECGHCGEETTDVRTNIKDTNGTMDMCRCQCSYVTIRKVFDQGGATTVTTVPEDEAADNVIRLLNKEGE